MEANMSTITFTKDAGGNPDIFFALDGRFRVEAERTAGGYVRGWVATDLTKPESANRRTFFGKNRSDLKGKIEEAVSRELSPEKRAAVEEAVKLMLHACRDTMRIRFHSTYVAEGEKPYPHDPSKVRFDTRMADYGEAFGVMRGLVALGLIEFGAVTDPTTAQGWLSDIEAKVLQEEGFGGDGKCERCFSHYKRDDARPRGA
jgi:hypothetical protein